MGTCCSLPATLDAWAALSARRPALTAPVPPAPPPPLWECFSRSLGMAKHRTHGTHLPQEGWPRWPFFWLPGGRVAAHPSPPQARFLPYAGSAVGLGLAGGCHAGVLPVEPVRVLRWVTPAGVLPSPVGGSAAARPPGPLGAEGVARLQILSHLPSLPSPRSPWGR